MPRSHQFSSYGWYTGTALSNFTRIASQAGALRKAQGYVVINKDINGVGKSLCRCGLRIFGPKCPFSLSQLLNPPRDMFGFCQLLAWQGMDTSITPRPNKWDDILKLNEKMREMKYKFGYTKINCFTFKLQNKFQKATYNIKFNHTSFFFQVKSHARSNLSTTKKSVPFLT